MTTHTAAAMSLRAFSQRIFKLDINPCVNLPKAVINELFKQAGRTKGPIPVRGYLNGERFKQTVVKYRSAWRLYLNGEMRSNAGIDIGDMAAVELEFDPVPRIVPMHPVFTRALSRNKKARAAFGKLTPSHQKEILRYLHSLKTKESVVRNVGTIIRRLVGKRATRLNALMRASR
ncbi:MAG: YdeI/OmpD-associated family protein [Bacteroidota bacterium]